MPISFWLRGMILGSFLISMSYIYVLLSVKVETFHKYLPEVFISSGRSSVNLGKMAYVKENFD